jgi:hypothetical protein
MVEAMVALTLVDAIMMQQAQCELFPNEAPPELRPNPIGSTARRNGEMPMVHHEVNMEPAGPVSQRVDEE